MAGRRVLYLAVLLGCLGFYYAYREWFAWFLLVGLLCLPPLSLLLSLPAMLTTRVRLKLPEEVLLGAAVETELAYSCKFPLPPIRCKLAARHCVTGRRIRCAIGDSLPTEHCGAWEITPKKLFGYDYLGLLRLPLRKAEPRLLRVMPKSLALPEPPPIQRYLANAWKPKPGGGFAETYDLRLYRPGDNLHQIHWKLAAKTGELIYRESMEPVKNLLVLSLILPGAEAELDDSLGKLLWLSGYLLEQQLSHEIRCLTGEGLLCLPVGSDAQLQDALGRLLSAPAAPADAQLPAPEDAVWHYRIGGEPDAV